MIQEIRCIKGDGVIVGSVELKDGETYKGDEHYGYLCPNHEEEKPSPVDVEYQLYLKRKADGEKAFLMLMSELRIKSQQDNLPREINRDIEDRLELVKSQVIEGQWISALEKLQNVQVAGYLNQALFDRIKLSLETYILENY